MVIIQCTHWSEVTDFYLRYIFHVIHDIIYDALCDSNLKDNAWVNKTIEQGASIPASETLTMACCVVGFGIKEFVRAFYFLVGGWGASIK